MPIPFVCCPCFCSTLYHQNTTVLSTMHHDSLSTMYWSFTSVIQGLMTATNMRPNAPPTVPATLEHLLSSNERPSETEISLLRDLHASFSAQLTRLDDEIATLLSSPDSKKTRALEQMEDDRAVLQNRSRQTLGALSTIRKFPQEILQEIFLHLIPDAGFLVLDPTQGVWAASRVCRSWRSASRHPHLWTNFRITSGRCGCIGDGGGFSHRCPTFIRYKNPVAILRTALRHSGSCMLAFHVEIQANDCIGNRSRIHRLLDELMLHSERWASVSFVVPCELGVYLGGVEGRVPELRQLTFVGCDPQSSWAAWGRQNTPHINAFDVAPKLRRVSVENAVLRLDYIRLTSFTSNYNVKFPTPVPPRFVILSCVHLLTMEANLVGYTGNSDIVVNTQKRILSNTSLTHLTINDPALLTHLSFPALHSLDTGDMDRSSCLVLIPPFLYRSECSLTRLYLRDSALAGEPLANILELVPCLTDLGIGFYKKTTIAQGRRIDLVLVELMKSLLVVDGEGEQHRLVPDLESIDFLSRIFWPGVDCRFVGPDLVRMLRSRKSTMRRASIRWAVTRFPTLNQACVVALQKMKQEGLDITVCALKHVGGSVL